MDVILHSPIGSCQCCGIEFSRVECVDCHLQTHLRCNLLPMRDRELCISCQRKRQNLPIPNCCLCSTNDSSLLIMQLHDDVYVHCVCLKALASYLYLNMDDSYVYQDFNLTQANSVPKTCQSFSNFFVTFFREHYRPLKHQFLHLSHQFVDFIRTQYSHALEDVSSFFSSLDNGTHNCIYCSLSDKLLIKCQHPNCMTFCHFPCHLQHHNYACHHRLLNNASVALLFYCDEHRDDVPDPTPTAPTNSTTTVTRFMEKKLQIKEEANQMLRSILSNNLPTSVNPQVLSMLCDYPTLLELDAKRCSTLQWLPTSRDVEEVNDPVVVTKPVIQDYCAICRGLLNDEVFPCLSSQVAVCQDCKVSVHCFCENISEKERKYWKCSRCRHADNPISCFFCKKMEGFLSSFSIQSTSIHAHYPCYFHSLLHVDTYECNCCHSQDAVFRCWFPGCTYSRDYLCAELEDTCFFYYPYENSTFFFFACPSHISAISSYLRTIQSSNPSVSLSSSHRTLCHALRSLFSFSSVHVYNNQPACLSLKNYFYQLNQFSKKTEKKKRKKRKTMKENIDKPYEYVESEDLTEDSGNLEMSESEEISRLPHKESSINEFSCEDIWALTDQYFWKKAVKRDITQLLRRNPKHTFPVHLPSGTIQLPPYPEVCNEQQPFMDEQQIFNVFPSIPLPTKMKKTTRASSVISNETPFIFQGFNSKDVSYCREEYSPYIDEEVIAWFHENHYCTNISIRNATVRDIPRLLEVNTINPLYFREEDLLSSMNSKNEFIMVAERKNGKGKRGIVGMIHYYIIWYYPHSISRKHSIVNPPAPENIQPQKVIYVCTLQTVQQATHANYIQRIGTQSEYGLGKLLFCLACQHGIKTGMKYLLLDSTKEAVPFYTSTFHMTQNDATNRKYIPLQLKLDCFNYKMIYNPILQKDPHFTLHCTMYPPESNVPVQGKKATLHLQFNSACELISSSVERQQTVPLPDPDLSLLYTSTSPTEQALALSSLVNYSAQSKTKVDVIDVAGHFLPLFNTSNSQPLLIHEYLSEGKSNYDEVSIELIRLIDELRTCMKQNYAITSKVTEEMMDELLQEGQHVIKVIKASKSIEVHKRSHQEIHQMEGEEKPKRKRGRPPKKQQVSNENEDEKSKQDVERAKTEMESEKKEEPKQNQKAKIKNKRIMKEKANVKPKPLKEKKETKSRKQQTTRKMITETPVSEVSISNIRSFFRVFDPSQERITRLELKHFIKENRFTEIFIDTKSPYNVYLRNYFGGIPKNLLIRGELNMQHILDSDNAKVISLRSAIALIQNSKTNSKRLSTLIYACCSVALFSVYPPHVVVTTCGSTNKLVARSQMADLQKLCYLCNQLAEMIADFNRVLNKVKNTSRTCICGESADQAMMTCKQCCKKFHCSCLGLIPTEYPHIVQTKYWGYWAMDRGFVCPFCCRSDLFEMSRMVKKVVQIKDQAVRSWQTKRKK